jgi:hypothetical protein
MADTGEFWTAKKVSNYLRNPYSIIYKLAQDKVFPVLRWESTCSFVGKQSLNGLRREKVRFHP